MILRNLQRASIRYFDSWGSGSGGQHHSQVNIQREPLAARTALLDGEGIAQTDWHSRTAWHDGQRGRGWWELRSRGGH